MDDTTYPPPRQVGPERTLTLTGMLMPWKDGQPVLVHMFGLGSLVPYLPLFGDAEQLRSVLARVDVPFDSIKQIDDGVEFLASVPPDIVVITDLRITPEGKFRYFQVQR